MICDAKLRVGGNVELIDVEINRIKERRRSGDVPDTVSERGERIRDQSSINKRGREGIWRKDDGRKTLKETLRIRGGVEEKTESISRIDRVGDELDKKTRTS